MTRRYKPLLQAHGLLMQRNDKGEQMMVPARATPEQRDQWYEHVRSLRGVDGANIRGPTMDELKQRHDACPTYSPQFTARQVAAPDGMFQVFYESYSVHS